MPYASEAVFVNSFVKALMQEGPLRATCYIREFNNGTSSRPDVVAVSEEGEVIAFEAKLTKWRAAMQQAHRNAFFADRSYVLLPPAAAERAKMNLDEFALRRVGICTLMDGTIHIVADAPLLDPHNIYRREMARERALKRRRRRRR
jgi:hypothetical protein